ncbi:citrate lyase holo-[acyl-carrier protein] synthase [Lactiplantibacillus paraplantarum]|uniref:citrate lyase holo-[acyl-carrier protein] synthase n=1 Tax=Lactiplantibacillus paraplantarum TaxID=60520 RepID=UPI000512DD92|nr:citrate lyase holo-[acyl-carrier protein] synthase [Lactiplantibacillus paraplantarum]OAX76275.1 apo-citrate lyase phosphoribosyl-dephospho-CoA transferase [Lactiplantibacillus plantarum]ALO02980.1 apo-citrate lyase phosphoribosyl-dephospho-CoA transferase [Lactiplantibacillus paraplantarum]KGE74947.1 apo-citrate lyase phosphoribosyl-dephospho-CoA transferase [Lactiplantibacillus paraplantarum]MCT4458642.1 citrate lyase holo-[acyl-carrier protein] synthase [Lactiplantibacillus paraplantarum]
MATIFTAGTPQTITDMLAARDQRVAYQQQLMTTHPQATIAAIKLNIPGPIKNNDALRRLFLAGVQRFEAELSTYTVAADWNHPAGNERFLILTTDFATSKRMAVAFEEQDPLGRLYDIDILQAGSQRALSRTDLGLPKRRCLLCRREAKDCARSRRHSVAELQQKIMTMYVTEFGDRA